MLNIAFIPSNVSGVMFYRTWQPAEAMRKYWSRRCKVAYLWYNTQMDKYPHTWERDLLDPNFQRNIYNDINMACQWADRVIWMGLHTPQSLNVWLEMKRRYEKIFLMDLDDDYFHIYQEHQASEAFYPGSIYNRIIYEQMTNSDGLIVSTPFLAELYQDYNSHIAVVENAIDLDLWADYSPSQLQRVNIGWVGGAYHVYDLLSIKKALFEVLDKYVDVQFTCLHAVPKEFKDHPKIKWSNEFWPIDKYPNYVMKHKFDIGISPLIDNTLNRCKSNLKWLEYSAMGIPTVASPVGHYKRTIVHRKTGLLADTKEEWVSCLSSLIESAYLRRTIGENAKETVRQNWSPIWLADKYLRCLKEFKNAKSNKKHFGSEDQGFNRRPFGHEVVSICQAG